MSRFWNSFYRLGSRAKPLIFGSAPVATKWYKPTLIWMALRWRHNGHDGVSNHQPNECLLNRLFRRRSKKPSKLRVTGLCVGNSSGTGEFPAQMASNAENVPIWWRHHGTNNIHHAASTVPHFQKMYLVINRRHSVQCYQIFHWQECLIVMANCPEGYMYMYKEDRIENHR